MFLDHTENRLKPQVTYKGARFTATPTVPTEGFSINFHRSCREMLSASLKLIYYAFRAHYWQSSAAEPIAAASSHRPYVNKHSVSTLLQHNITLESKH